MGMEGSRDARMEPMEPHEDEGFEALAAELKLAHRDSSAFLDLLAERFERALTACVSVRRRWGVLGGRVVELRLQVGDFLYRFEAPNPPFYTVTRQRVVNGIAVGTAERLGGDVWPERLCADLSELARRERLSARALERMLLGG